MRRLAASAVDLVAMAAVGAAIWFWWNPLMDYLPNRFANDVDAVIVWLGGEEPSSRDWLRWVAEIEWVVGAVLVALLLWLTEKLVGLVRTRVLRAG